MALINDALIKDLRDQIAANDAVIIAALNKRLQLVTRLWRCKAARGMERRDQAREDFLHGYLARHNRGPMSVAACSRAVDFILDLTESECEWPE